MNLKDMSWSARNSLMSYDPQNMTIVGESMDRIWSDFARLVGQSLAREWLRQTHVPAQTSAVTTENAIISSCDGSNLVPSTSQEEVRDRPADRESQVDKR